MGQPKLQRRIDQIQHLGLVEHAPGITDPGLARDKGLVLSMDQAEILRNSLQNLLFEVIGAHIGLPAFAAQTACLSDAISTNRRMWATVADFTSIVGFW